MIDPKTVIENTVRIESLQSDLKDAQDRLKKLSTARIVILTIAAIIGISSTIISSYAINTFFKIKGVSEAADSAQRMIEKFNTVFNQAKIQNFKPGMILVWHSKDPPDGWLLCDGTEFVSKDNPELYESLTGEKYKSGSPRLTKTPDYQNRFLRGAPKGKEAGTPVKAAVGPHSHPMFGKAPAGTPRPLSGGAHNNEYAAYSGTSNTKIGQGEFETYEIKIAASSADEDIRGHTFDNKSDGNWPAHVTVHFIIKHDTPEQNNGSD